MMIVLVSCYTTKYVPITDEMNKWIGKSEHDLLLDKGTPTKITEDGKGGKIFNYSVTDSRVNTYPVYGYGTTSEIYSNTVYMEFYVNPVDTIYYWRTNKMNTEKYRTGLGHY